jgi:hypothetical protein
MLDPAPIFGVIAARRGPGEAYKPALAIVKWRLAFRIAAFDELCASCQPCDAIFFSIMLEGGRWMNLCLSF